MRHTLRLVAAGLAVLAGVPLLLACIPTVWRAIGWRTIAVEEKAGLGGAFGYRLKSPVAGVDDLALAFSGPGFSIQLESPGYSLNRVLDSRWLCEDRAVYLSIDVKRHYSSYWLDETVKAVFDFERGNLYTLNSPWRYGISNRGRSHATTEAEFD